MLVYDKDPVTQETYSNPIFFLFTLLCPDRWNSEYI